MTTINTIGLVIAGVIVSVLFSAGSTSVQLGGIYNQVITEFRQGFKAGTSNQLVISSAGVVTSDLSVTGGTLTVPTTANATSTVTVGCVQTYATSSATAIKLIFNTVATTTGNGFTLWSYGTCPNL